MMQPRSEREMMLHKINVISFICVEMQLYLDTHPYECDAIEYFNRNMTMLNELKHDYSQKNTPLNLSNANHSDQKWEWVLDPMPWEGGC